MLVCGCVSVCEWVCECMRVCEFKYECVGVCTGVVRDTHCACAECVQVHGYVSLSMSLVRVFV